MTKKPKPEPGAPRDWGHHQAKLAEHLNRLEARLIVVEAVLKGRDQTDAPSPEAELEARYTAPPGVVSPHVRENLEALREWARPGTEMHEQIGVALAGGDVRRPLHE